MVPPGRLVGRIESGDQVSWSPETAVVATNELDYVGTHGGRKRSKFGLRTRCGYLRRQRLEVFRVAKRLGVLLFVILIVVFVVREVS